MPQVRVDVKESYFWSQVKAGLEDPHTHLSRIENTAGTGISDVSACRGGVEAWLELKIVHGKVMSFRNSQRTWIVKRTSCGGRVFVLARYIDELFLYSALDCVMTHHKPASNGKSFTIELGHLIPIYQCGKPFRWAEVRDKIFDPSWAI